MEDLLGCLGAYVLPPADDDVTSHAGQMELLATLLMAFGGGLLGVGFARYRRQDPLGPRLLTGGAVLVVGGLLLAIFAP